MKRIHLFSTLILLFTAMNLTSCDVEPLDPAIDQANEGSDDGTDPSDDGPGDGGESSGDYWPAALNNKWVFAQDGSEFDMKIISTNSIEGNTYYTFNEQTGQGGTLTATGTMRLRKTGGNYYIRIEDVVTPAEDGMPGSTTTGSEIVILKDNVAVGATWSQTFTQSTSFTDPMFPTITLNMSVNGKILEKDATVIVGGVTYTNVIKSQIQQTVSMMGTPAGTTTTFYYLSKDVGPVKIEYAGTGLPAASELVSYELN